MERTTGKRILVTGATGYVGSNLVRALRNENELFCVRRKESLEGGHENVKWLQWDMVRDLDPRALPEKLDVIIHLAMNPARDPERNLEAFRVNTLSTLQLLEYGRRSGIESFVYASSGSVYGFGPKPFKEDGPVAINDFYSTCKYSSELLVRQYGKSFASTILRYFVPYGPLQTGKLVPNLMDRIRKGEAVTITNDGNPVMNPIYIDDLVEATIRAMCLKGLHVLNVGGAEPLSILDIATAIGDVMGKSPVLTRVSDPAKLGQDLVGDIGKIKSVLSFAPEVRFKQGIKTLVEWPGANLTNILNS